jgi:hypothetical protein
MIGFLRRWFDTLTVPNEVVRAQQDEIEELREQVVKQAASLIRLRGSLP